MIFKRGNGGGILSQLRRNQAGNTLAIVAAAIIPLLGLVGGGIDMSRLYLTKARLQQACDAGSLAGRKQMGSGSWSASNNKAEKVAKELFDANFGTNPYGTSNTSYSFSESSGKVTGTASVVVPMTIMKVFGQNSKTINVTCDAEMRIPNTDVMFVLDTTGSMDDIISGDTIKKIDGLKKAVKCFYEALAKVDIDNVDCGSTPSGGNSSTVQLRFGFVPYAVNVNVGKLLKNEWMADSANYQTRVPQFTTQNVQNGYNDDGTPSLYGTPTTSNNQYGSWQTYGSTYSGITQSSCAGKVPADTSSPSSAEGSAYNQTSWTSGSSQVIQWYTDQNYSGYKYTYSWSRTGGRNSTTGNCTVQSQTWTYKLTRTYRKTNSPHYEAQSVFSGWKYKQAPLNVSSLKAGGSNWNSSVTLPIGANGTDASVAWNGCIEERKTWQNTDGDPSNDYDPIPASAWDMDIDMVPTTDADTRWKPMLPDAVWGRVDSSLNKTQSEVTITGTWYSSWWTTYGINDMPRNRDDPAYCPRPARKLTIYKTSSEVTDFKNYVDALTPDGNTYHDIGLIWGARLMSPTGLFASENAFTPNGGTIERHMIFMTDGASVASNTNYTAYGVPWWDRRQATSTDNGVLKSTIDARLTALCSAIKNKNITLWVIYYGAAGSDDYNRLNACASSGRFYNATNSTQLIDKFKAIASEISQLRLTN